MEKVATPLVSIIMPCYNSSGTISSSLASVCSQDYPNFELIVVDDCSTDSSREVIEEFARIDGRIKLICNEGKHGVSYARNLGISAALGRYICFLDSDDFYLPGAISSLVNFAQENSFKLVFGSYERLLPTGHVYRVVAPTRVSFKDMLKRNYIGNLTGLYDTEYFGKVFQEDIRHEDYLMWCSMLQRIDFAHSITDKPIGVYRVSSNSLSGNKLKAFRWHWLVLREGLRVNLFSALYYQLFYMVASVVDRLPFTKLRNQK